MVTRYCMYLGHYCWECQHKKECEEECSVDTESNAERRLQDEEDITL